MRPRQPLALCAVALTLTVATSAVAQEAGQPALRGAGSTAAAPKRAAHRKAAPASARAAVPRAAAPVTNSYQLVPTNPAGSALARARQNSFGTPDDDAAPSSGSRRIGIGLGGSNGTTPGVTMGF